jgi:hypothetical protein
MYVYGNKWIYQQAISVNYLIHHRRAGVFGLFLPTTKDPLKDEATPGPLLNLWDEVCNSCPKRQDIKKSSKVE